MNGWLPRVLVMVVLLALVTSSADAQRRRRAIATSPGPRYGAHGGYDFDDDAVLVGAQLSWPVSRQLDFYPTFDYYFVDPGSLWALNFDVKFRPPTRYAIWYVGGGLNLAHASLNGAGRTDTHLNLLTGLEARRGRTRPYVEGRFILGDNSIFQLALGLSWR